MKEILSCEINNSIVFEPTRNNNTGMYIRPVVCDLFSDVLFGEELLEHKKLIEKWCSDGIIDVGTILVFDRKGHSTILPGGKTDLIVYDDGDEYVLKMYITKEVSFGTDDEDYEEEDDVWEEKMVRIPKN